MRRYLNVFFLFLAIISLFAALLFPASAAFASPLLVPTLGPTKTDAIIGDDGDGKADPGEIIEYTVTIPNTVTDATGVVFDDNPDANTTFVGGSLAASPVAVNDTYPETVIGNVSINSALIPYNVVSNDFLGVNPTATISAFDATSANGGQVTMTTSGAGLGQFTYNPPPGFEGTDTFTYTLTDNANATSAALNRTATVSIPVSGMVWFINNTAASCTTLAAGCGRLSNPFSTMAAFNALNNSTGNNPAANDNIFVYESGSQYTGTLTLLSGQKLIGQDATASLNTITSLTPPSSSATFPVMNSANGTITNLGGTVMLNTNTTVRGLQINSTTSTALNDPASAITGVNMSDISVSSTTATAVALSDIGGSFTFKSISSNGGTSDGISITNQTGSFTVNGDGSNTSVGGNSTGGTISGKSGSDGSTTSGIGIYLNNVQNITLRRMTINGTNQNYGIRGNLVNGFVLEYSTVSGTNGTAASLVSPETYGEGAIHFGNAVTNGVMGTVTFTNNVITGGRARDLSIVNTAAGTTTLTVKGNTLGGMQNFSDGNQCFAVEARVNSGIIINTTFGGTNAGEGNTINNCVSDNVNFTGQNNTTMDVIFRNNTLSNNNPNNIIGGGNLVLATLGTMTFHVTGNTMRDANGSAVTLFKGSASSGTPNLSGFFDSNTIGVAGTTDSGSKTGNGIYVSAGGTGTMSYTITNNAIHQVHGNFHISADNTGGSYTANFDIRGNTFDTPGAGNAGAIGLTNGSPTSSDTVNVCAIIGGSSAADKNTLSGFAGGVPSIYLGSSGAASGHTFNLPGLATFTEAGVESFVTGNNTMGGSLVDAYADSPATFAAFKGNPGCTTPIAMVPNSSDQMASVNLNSTNLFKQTSYTFTNDTLNTFVSPVKNFSGIGTHPSTHKAAPALSGGIVSVTVGTLPAGKSVTIKFRVTVNGPSLPLGTFQLSNQGTISGSNFGDVLTDDPAIVGASDPTTTPVDRPDTTVASINRAGSSPTNANSVSWTVTFADAVLNLSSSNFTLANNGLAGTPAITSVTAASGPPSTTWTVTASTGTGDGTLGLDMVNDTGLSHDVTNLTFTGQVYSIDKTAPTVTNVNSNAVNGFYKAGDVISIQVVLSEAVNVTGTPQLTLETGATDRVVNYTSGSGTNTLTFSYTVQAGDTSSDLDYAGTSSLALNGGTIRDTAQNDATLALPVPGAAGSLSANQGIAIDTTAPTLLSFTRFDPATSPTSADQLIFNVLFSEQVAGIGTTDFAVDGTTTATISGLGIINTNGLYQVTISGGDLANFNGVVGLNFSNTAAMTDLAANAFAVAEPATDETYTVDNSNPSITINQAVAQADPTSTSPINFTVVFSKAVTGFVTGDVTLGGTANPTTGTVTEIAPNDGTTYNVAVSGMSGSGTVTASIAAGVAQDVTLNTNAASTSTDNTVTYDVTAPTITINQAAGQVDPTGVSPINFTVVFSEAVTGFTATDVSLSGTAGATTAVVTGGPTTFDVAVSGMTSLGTVVASIPSGAASDTAGNPSAASTSTDNTVTFTDNVPPTVVSSVRTDPSPTSAANVHFTVTFSESVTGVDSTDFSLTTTGLSGTTVTGITGSGSVYTVTVNVGTGSSGTLRLDVSDDDSIKDAFNNLLGGTGAGNGNFSGGETYTISSLATVQVAIGGTGYGPYSITPPGGQIVNVAGINTGAVNVFSTNTTPILPAERVIYTVNNTPTSFSEMMGLPDSQLDTTYWMPWYNNVDLDSQLRFANVSPSTATVHVYIGGQEMTGSPFTLTQSGANQSLRVSFDNVNSGPVQIASDVPIVAAERVIYKINGLPISFSEMMGLPDSKLDNRYWMPWYNNLDLDTQLRFGNASSSPVSVRVFIGGQEKTTGCLPSNMPYPYVLGVGESLRLSCPGVNSGPVEIRSSGNIVAAERVIYNVNGLPTSFSEMMGLPNSQLDTTYWIPWHDNVNPDSQMRFANVSASLATIHVFIAGTEVTGSPFTLAAGIATRVSFAGLNSGPLKIVSDVPIVIANRVIYQINNIPTSFSEMMGLPDGQLDTSYWMPWHNNVDLDTKIRLSVP